jgi:signal transduction histidine kinase
VAFCLEQSQRASNYQFEYRMTAADGRTVWVHDIVNVVSQGGVPRTLRGFLVDVTQQRQAEEESRQLREQFARVGRVSLMGEVAASIAHEVNQPLCAVVSNAQAVQRMLASGRFVVADMREALEDITRDGQRASAVIARIRGFLQKGLALRAPVDVNDLVREVAGLGRSEMALRGVALRLELAADLPPVLGDRVQLQQVVLNLITNGADAMDRVARDLRELVVSSTAGEGDTVRVVVRDAGVGLDPRNCDRIFEPLFTTKAGGMGMGLAMCKTILEAHGGKIWAVPNPDVGTSIQFTLPTAPPAPPASPEEADGGPRGGEDQP